MQDIKSVSSQEESCDSVLSGATAKSPITGLSLPAVQPLLKPTTAIEMNTQLILQALVAQNRLPGQVNTPTASTGCPASSNTVSRSSNAV